MTELEDNLLWQMYRQGNDMAFSELFRRYYKKLVYYGLKFTQDVDEIEDTIQELMIRLWTKRQVVNDTDSVKFYLLKSFRHLLFRKLKRPVSYTQITEELTNAIEENSSEYRLIENESEVLLQKRIRQTLTHLTPRQREIIYLRFFQNLTPSEIGTLLSINSQSVSNIIHRAFVKIRETLSDVSLIPSLILTFYKFFFF